MDDWTNHNPRPCRLRMLGGACVDRQLPAYDPLLAAIGVCQAGPQLQENALVAFSISVSLSIPAHLASTCRA